MLVFGDTSWPGFLYFLKYSGFVCLRCTDQSLYDIKVNIVRAIESRADTPCFQISLAVLLCHTMIGQHSQCHFRLNTPNVHAYMHCFDRSL